ncbi:MAG: ATP-dependent zinc metalloprotease FtsH [Bacteroidales bacterium]|nr:ATP-dependent zinc metalloprotease FtsH [Bacteroidales bacterium]
MDFKKKNDNKSSNNKGGFSLLWMYGILFAIVIAGSFFIDDNSINKPVSWTEFESYVSRKGVKSIVVYNNTLKVEAELTKNLADSIFTKEQISKTQKYKVNTKGPSIDGIKDKIDKWQSDGTFTGDVSYMEEKDYSNLIWSYGPIILMIVIFIYIMRKMSTGGGPGGGVFSVGKSNAEVYDKDNSSKVTFNDVAGLAEAKTEVEEIVDFLKNPGRYTELGGKIPKGALLVGPPGTGKTLLARAVAGEANVPFFSMSGSNFVEMFVGVGASRVRDLFRQAKEKAPCIVFIDEIDAVGRARSKNAGMNSNDERESTLNQLLTEMDGFGTNSGVIILAATNRADILDKALLRAGRFDRQIYVELPDLHDRIEIFKVHLRNVKIDDTVDLELLARQTPGFSGADIANVCNEAALIAARRNKSSVQRKDFTDAVDRIIGGLEKRSKITTDEEKKSIAIHEAGHATVSWHLEYANPLIKVTIVPRGKALGAAWYLPEERQIVPQQAILDDICSLLAGRAAEEMFIGTVSTGAANDLERVTKQAYAMVVYYGMSNLLPNVCYYDSTGQDYMFSKPYSEDRAEIIDKEVSRIIQEQYQRAKDILKQYADGHAKLADTLLKNEVIFAEDAEKIFGKRQWTSRTDEILASRESGEKTADGENNNKDSEPTPPPIPKMEN